MKRIDFRAVGDGWSQVEAFETDEGRFVRWHEAAKLDESLSTLRAGLVAALGEGSDEELLARVWEAVEERDLLRAVDEYHDPRSGQHEAAHRDLERFRARQGGGG